MSSFIYDLEPPKMLYAATPIGGFFIYQETFNNNTYMYDVNPIRKK